MKRANTENMRKTVFRFFSFFGASNPFSFLDAPWSQGFIIRPPPPAVYALEIFRFFADWVQQFRSSLTFHRIFLLTYAFTLSATDEDNQQMHLTTGSRTPKFRQLGHPCHQFNHRDATYKCVFYTSLLAESMLRPDISCVVLWQ